MLFNHRNARKAETGRMTPFCLGQRSIAGRLVERDGIQRSRQGKRPQTGLASDLFERLQNRGADSLPGESRRDKYGFHCGGLTIEEAKAHDRSVALSHKKITPANDVREIVRGRRVGPGRDFAGIVMRLAELANRRGADAPDRLLIVRRGLAACDYGGIQWRVLRRPSDAQLTPEVRFR